MPKYTCPNCGNEFEGSFSYDELGCHTVCPICESSFNVDLPVEYRDAAIDIVELFEDLLECHNIMIPDEDRTGSEDEAPIYGCTFYNLVDEIACILYEHHSELGE